MNTTVQDKGLLITRDKEGYLTREEVWTEDKARGLAIEVVPEGLTEDHWKVIGVIRQYYLQMGTVPPVRMLARRTGFSLRQMQKLFPTGLSKGACIIAGIPQTAIRPSYLYP